MVDTYVVDTGVFVRWFLDQDGYEHAREIADQFQRSEISLTTSEMARVELAEVLRRKGHATGLLDLESFVTAARSLDDTGVDIRPIDVKALGRATRWAIRLSLRIFDAIFVDLALQTGFPLLTTDNRLARAVSQHVPIEILRPS